MSVVLVVNCNAPGARGLIKGAKMNYIYSTLSNDQNYTVWMTDPKSQKLPIQEKVIPIAGKANIANKVNLITPRGVLTTVDDDQLKALQSLDSFNRQVKGGWIVVEKKKADADEVAKNMKGKDKSAQLDEKSIKKNTTAKVKSNAKG